MRKAVLSLHNITYRPCAFLCRSGHSMVHTAQGSYCKVHTAICVWLQNKFWYSTQFGIFVTQPGCYLYSTLLTTVVSCVSAILQRQSVRAGQVKIQGVATCIYLCMDSCGLLYGSVSAKPLSYSYVIYKINLILLYNV